MSLDELLRERIGALPPTMHGEPEPVFERVVAGGRKRRARARLVAGASVAAMLVLIGAATLSLTGDSSAQIDFVGPGPAEGDRSALPDCDGLDMRYAHRPIIAAGGGVLAFIDRPLGLAGTATLGQVVVCSRSGHEIVRKPGGDPIDVTGVALSADGRFVVFDGRETIGGSSRERYRAVWVVDRRNAVFERISDPAPGGRLNEDSIAGAISDDGRWIAFISAARLTGERGFEGSNVYLRDRARGTTTLLTTGLGEGLETQDAFSQLTRPDVAISMAGDGTLVFNTLDGVFLHDPRRGSTRLVRRGLPAKISHDGRFLLQPERVVTPDVEPPPRVRVLELASGREELIPFGPTERERYVTITDAAISGSGRYVVAALRIQQGLRQPDGSSVTMLRGSEDHWGGGPLIVHDRATGRASTVLERINATDLGVSADGRGVIGSMGDAEASFRGLNGVVLVDTAVGTATRVTWNPPWYEGRAWALTMWAAVLLTLSGLYQLWRLWLSPLRSNEIKQLGFLVATIGGIAGWAAIVPARGEVVPLLFLGVPILIVWLLRPHRWRLRRVVRA